MREQVVLQIHLHVRRGGDGGVRLLVFECPLLFGTVQLAEVVDTGVSLGRIARPNEVRNRDGGQQTDDGDHDHDFHEREAGFA